MGEKDISSTSSENPAREDSLREGRVVLVNAADETHDLVKEHGATVGELTPEKFTTLKRKLYLRVVLLATVINFMLFVDKSTLGQAALLGLLEDTKIGNSEYNNLNTIFYVGYVVGQIPGHFLIQHLPLRVYVTGTIFIWGVLVFLHCVASSYGGLIPLRFFLAMAEAPMVPALEITMSMFFPPKELYAIQPLFWTSCVGSPIITGLIAYGLLWSQSSVSPWKFFMIITGGLSVLLAVVTWFAYPSNPATANFLTVEEKVHTIRRVHEATKSSIEQKKFKKYQFIEALCDPISWLFTLATFLLMLANNLAFQLSLLYLDLGVSNLGSTLVWVAAGGFAVIVCIVASILLRAFPGYNAYWSTLWCLPAIAGSIGMVALSWDKTIPLLACLLLATNTWGMTYIISFAWTSSSCAGHTKKLTRNALFMAAYGISNIISPQMWKSGGPRYYATWIVQTILSFVMTPLILILIRWILNRRNEERKEWIAEQASQGNYGEGYIEQQHENGETTKVKVDISLLDLTDLENKFFIYPL
ncbi:unnamed protein product [Clonostachys solani]|uniref:Major facilitator superfamily (MFS) profile domain-containing protein n=1 Tax=Clonostachys solani TaxID=160281 RepID=A0A9N9ZL71_9HYPO|nr:unnamed protein product [Clonostachys solani]